MQKVKINQIKNNPNNPRIIKDEKFNKLVQSIKELPEMALVRPIVVNKDFIVLGGNMRLKAMREAGWKEVPIEIVDWSEQKQRAFIIKDNVGFGEWDYEMLANEWDIEDLTEWGVEVPNFKNNSDLNYDLLDDEEISEKVSDMEGGVKKAIMIEFESEHYEEAFELIKFWREQKLYIGKYLMDKLNEEKNNL